MTGFSPYQLRHATTGAVLSTGLQGTALDRMTGFNATRLFWADNENEQVHEMRILTPVYLEKANTVSPFDELTLVVMDSFKLFNIVVGCTKGAGAKCIAVNIITSNQAWSYTLSNIGVSEPLYQYLGGSSKNIIIADTKGSKTAQTMISSTATAAPVPDF